MSGDLSKSFVPSESKLCEKEKSHSIKSINSFKEVDVNRDFYF